MTRALTLVFALGLGVSLAQDADPRARLAQVIQREQQLLDVLRRVREGSTVKAREVLTPLPVAQPTRSHHDPESAFANAQLFDPEPAVEHEPQPPVQPEVSAVDSQTHAVAHQPAKPVLAPLPATYTDPQRLGDAYLVAGEAVAALDAYERAAERAEAHGTPVELARARYGVARSLEALEQFEAALDAYGVVEKLPEAGVWAQAAGFARTFISWRQQVASPPTSNPSHKEHR